MCSRPRDDSSRVRARLRFKRVTLYTHLLPCSTYLKLDKSVLGYFPATATAGGREGDLHLPPESREPRPKRSDAFSGPRAAPPPPFLKRDVFGGKRSVGEHAESERQRRVDARDRNPRALSLSFSRSLPSALAPRDAWVSRGVPRFPHTSFRIVGTFVLEFWRIGRLRTTEGRSRTFNLACIVQVRRVGTQICFVYLLRIERRGEERTRAKMQRKRDLGATITSPRQGEFDVVRRHFRGLFIVARLCDFRHVVRHLFPGRMG